MERSQNYREKWAGSYLSALNKKSGIERQNRDDNFEFLQNNFKRIYEGEQREFEGRLVTVHAEDAYLPSILSILARESGYNIVTDPNVNRQEQLTIHLDDVPIQQAINLVVRAVGLSYEIVGNSFLIAEPKKLAEEVGITSHVVELKYADAMELKDLLQDLTDKIQVDVSGNKLLINASPKRIAEIEDAIKEIDVPALQILLEVRLIEVAVDAEEKLGIDWSVVLWLKNLWFPTFF